MLNGKRALAADPVFMWDDENCNKSNCDWYGKSNCKKVSCHTPPLANVTSLELVIFDSVNLFRKKPSFLTDLIGLFDKSTILKSKLTLSVLSNIPKCNLLSSVWKELLEEIWPFTYLVSIEAPFTLVVIFSFWVSGRPW